MVGGSWLMASRGDPQMPRRTSRAALGRTSDPMENTNALRLPRKSQRRSGGDPATPGRPGPRQGVHPTRWRTPKCCTCRANHSGAATPGRHQGVHPTPWRDWLLAIGGRQLVGGNWLVAIGGWQLVDDNWLMTIGW